MDNNGKFFFYYLFSDLYLASICKNMTLFRLAVMIVLYILAEMFYAAYPAFV